MPRLSDSMSEGTIVGWLKRPGEAFLRGDPLVEVETDKATVVYEAESDGLLGEILVPEGGVAALGEAIARLGGGDGAPRPAAVDRPEPAMEVPRPLVASPAPAPAQPRRDDAGAGDARGAPDRGLARSLARRTRRHGPGWPHPQAGRGASRINGAAHRRRPTSRDPPRWSSCRRRARRSRAA